MPARLLDQVRHRAREIDGKARRRRPRREPVDLAEVVHPPDRQRLAEGHGRLDRDHAVVRPLQLFEDGVEPPERPADVLMPPGRRRR